MLDIASFLIRVFVAGAIGCLGFWGLIRVLQAAENWSWKRSGKGRWA